MNFRTKHEIEHGKMLAADDTELIWGWGTPAGRIRARKRANLIAQGAHLGPGVYALEVGCGTGMFTGMFAETGASLVAVDLSGDLLQKARERGLPGNQVRFVKKAFEDCDMYGPFDAVIGSSVLHHLDLEPALLKMRDILKPGGIISFAEPNMLNPQIFIERRFRRWFPYVSPDETAFVSFKLRDVLVGAGFEKVEITPFDWLHPATPAGLIDVVEATSFFLERIPLLREFAGSLYIRACHL